jgi:hypothetical protein
MKYTIAQVAAVQLGYQHRGRVDLTSTGTHWLVQVKDIDRDDRFIDQFPIPTPHRLWTGSLYGVTPSSDPHPYQVHPGDVLFLYRGHRNFAVPIVPSAVQPFPERWESIIAAYYFYILRPRPELIDPEYLAWFINSPQSQAALATHARGSHMKMIPKQDFLSLPINVPDLATQRKINAVQDLAYVERKLASQLEQKRLQLLNAICNRATYRS